MDKTERMKTAILFFISHLYFPLMAADPVAVCPQENDPTTAMAWNLAAVMRTYRDSLNNSEEVLLAIVRGDEQAKTKIPAVIDEIQKSIDCAAYVDRNFSGSMMATSILERPVEDQQKFIDLYKEMCSKTLEMFRTLRDGLRLEMAKPSLEQNYQTSLDLIRAIHDYENRAHRKF